MNKFYLLMISFGLAMIGLSIFTLRLVPKKSSTYYISIFNIGIGFVLFILGFFYLKKKNK